ncbi:hypothetical protein BDAP_002342, partial [Binucleata daphniae]
IDSMEIGDVVRVAQHDNIDKYNKGRFLRKGKIMHKYDSGTCLVVMEDTGKIVKKNQCDMKLIRCDAEAGGGMLDP